MTTETKVKSCRVTWESDHEQYWQGHGVAFTDYDLSETGCGDTIREAFDDALDGLAQMDIHLTDEQEKELLTDLESQVKSPEMLSTSIVDAQCEVSGADFCECAVCSGEWHFYVSIDVEITS